MVSGEHWKFEQSSSAQLREMANLLRPDTPTKPYSKLAYDQLNVAADLDADYERSGVLPPDYGWAGAAAEELGPYAIWYGNIPLADYLYSRAGALEKWKLFAAARTDLGYHQLFGMWEVPVTDDMGGDETADDFHIARHTALTRIALFDY